MSKVLVEALEKIASAKPEAVFPTQSMGTRMACRGCGQIWWNSSGKENHAPDCTWVTARDALAEYNSISDFPSPSPSENRHQLRTQLEALFERQDQLRRALEIIAVGDALNPQTQAAEQLIAMGYWRDIPEARIPVTPSASASEPARVPIGYAIYWGLGRQTLYWPPYKSKDEALEKAKEIRSNTRVVPIYL